MTDKRVTEIEIDAEGYDIVTIDGEVVGDNHRTFENSLRDAVNQVLRTGKGARVQFAPRLVYSTDTVEIPGDPAPPPEPVALTIHGPQTLAVGERASYTAVIEYDDETHEPVKNPAWRYDKTILQLIDGTTGDFKSLHEGVATLACDYDDLEAEYPISVEAKETPPIEPPTDPNPTGEKVRVQLLADDDNHVVFDGEYGYGMHQFHLGNAFACICHDADGSFNVYNAYLGTKAAITGHWKAWGPDGTLICDEATTICPWAGTQPRRYKTPQAKKPDAAMLAMLPNYAPGQPYSYYDALKDRDYSLSGLGVSTTWGMPNTGARADIGMNPAWEVPAIVDFNDKNAEVVRWSGDSAAPWSMHAFDPATNQPAKITDYPNISNNWYFLRAGPDDNPFKGGPGFGSGPSDPNVAHLTHFGILPTLMFGTEYDKRELASWANFCQLTKNPAYRGYAKGDNLLTDAQVRARAWSFEQVYAAGVILDDDYYRQMAKHSLKQGIAFIKSEPGIVDVRSTRPYENHTAFAPWQLHYEVQALGYCYQLAKVANDADDQADLYWLLDALGSRVVIPSMGLNSGIVCYQHATTYSMQVRADNTSPVAKTYEEAYLLNAFAPGVCGELFAGYNNYQPDDMAGYPYSDTGYVAMMQPALAACVDAGLDGAQEALELYLEHKRWSGRQWKFNILPRYA